MAVKPAVPTQTTTLLRSVPLFAGASDRQLAAIAACTRTVHFEPGAVICREGSAGVGLHVVVSGTVRVSSSAGTTVALGPGAYFGEIALVDGGPRMATVVAESPVETLSIASWDFKDILDSQPGVLQHLVVQLCRRLREQAAAPTQ